MKKAKKTIFWLALFAVAALSSYFLTASIISIAAQDNSDEALSAEKIRRISGLNPNFDFLDGDLFSALQVNGDIPIDPQTEGRDNPFISY